VESQSFVTACCGAGWFIDRAAEGYAYEHENGTIEWCPVLRCMHCGREIGGDADLIEVEQ
jgi:hypothetical protein